MLLLAVLDACLAYLSPGSCVQSDLAQTASSRVLTCPLVLAGSVLERSPYPGRGAACITTHTHTLSDTHTQPPARDGRREPSPRYEPQHTGNLRTLRFIRERETMLPPTCSLRVIILSRPKIFRVIRLRESIVLFCMKVVATAARVVRAVHRRRGDRSDRLFFFNYFNCNVCYKSTLFMEQTNQ